MNKFEKIMKNLSENSDTLTPEQIKKGLKELDGQHSKLDDMSQTLGSLIESGKAKQSDIDQLKEVDAELEIIGTFLVASDITNIDKTGEQENEEIDTVDEFNLETGEIERGIEVQFKSEIKLPVQVMKYSGSYYPKDKRTKEESDVLLHKHESLFHDNNSHHPTMMFIHSLEQMPTGYFLGTMYLGYFNGKYETKIRYVPCTELEFQKAKNYLIDNKLSSWKTGLDVEVYGITETRGKYHSYEAYLIDTIRGYPVRMTLSSDEKLVQGVYSLDVRMERNGYNGSYKPVNEYSFNHKAEPLSNAQA